MTKKNKETKQKIPPSRDCNRRKKQVWKFATGLVNAKDFTRMSFLGTPQYAFDVLFGGKAVMQGYSCFLVGCFFGGDCAKRNLGGNHVIKTLPLKVVLIK